MKRIVLRSTDETREVPLDHPDLTRGWWAVERDGQMMSRWTNGEAVLPLPAITGPVMLEIHLAGTMTYAVGAAPEARGSSELPPDIRRLPFGGRCVADGLLDGASGLLVARIRPLTA